MLNSSTVATFPLRFSPAPMYSQQHKFDVACWVFSNSNIASRFLVRSGRECLYSWPFNARLASRAPVAQTAALRFCFRLDKKFNVLTGPLVLVCARWLVYQTSVMKSSVLIWATSFPPFPLWFSCTGTDLTECHRNRMYVRIDLLDRHFLRNGCCEC